MPVARFYCVHCGAPLKTSAELTPEKRIQCPKCETIFPVPAQLLATSEKPAGTMQLGGDLTTGIGAESPRVQLVGMEDILGPETPQSAAPETPARSPVPEAPVEPPPPARQAESAPEPWEEELGRAAMPQPASEAEAMPEWAGEEAGETERPSEAALEPTDIEPTEGIGAEPGEEIVASPEPEVVDLSEQETERKSSFWLWLVVLVLVLLLVGGVALAWYMGWLDPVLELLGLQSPKPSVSSSGTPAPGRSAQPQPSGDSPQSGPTSGSVQPLPTGTPPDKIQPPLDIFAALEKVFTEAPARPIADMQAWRYVPGDANLVICINYGELTLHPMVRQQIQRGMKQAQLAGKLDPFLPFDPSEIQEMLIAFRVDWEKPSEEQVGASLVAAFILHKPLDEVKLRAIVQRLAKDIQEQKFGERTVYYGTEAQGDRTFSCLIAPNVLVGGMSGREKAVPGLSAELHAAVPKEWEILARSAGNAQFAVLVRDVQMTSVFEQLGPLPPDAQPYVQVLQKARHALAKLELAPKIAQVHLNVTFSDAQIAQKASQLLQQLVDEQIKPSLPQLAAFAPELVPELQKSLRIAVEAESVQLSVSASYPALGNAIKNLAVMLGPALQGKPAFPAPCPVKP